MPNSRKSSTAKKDLVFAENLQAIRKQRGLTQLDLARLLDLPPPRISEIEGGRFPARERIVAIADALGCTCDELLRPKE